MLEMRKETGQSRAGDEPGTQQLLQDDNAQAAESDGERMPVKNGHAGEREGEKQKIDADRDVVSAEIGSEADGHVQGPTDFPDFSLCLSTQQNPVVDEIVGLGEAVVEEPRRRVPLAGVPIEPRPAALAAKREEILDQSPPQSAASHRRIDEQILKVAAGLNFPRAWMHDRDGEAGNGALPLCHAPEHAGARHEQPLPGRRRHRLAYFALVEGDIARPSAVLIVAAVSRMRSKQSKMN